MEENTPESLFRSLSFLRRFAGLNYYAIQSERGQRRRIYEFLLGLPLFIVAGIFFLRGSNPDSNTFRLEQFAICGLCFVSVYGFTRFVLGSTSGQVKDLMDIFAKKQDRILRKILIRYSLFYYGISFVVILILSFL
jgi:hypothetical protein